VLFRLAGNQIQVYAVKDRKFGIQADGQSAQTATLPRLNPGLTRPALVSLGPRWCAYYCPGRADPAEKQPQDFLRKGEAVYAKA